jgi:Fic family protein
MIKEFDNKTSKDIPIPIKAGIIEYEFVTIHPFWDGNGRTSRLLANYILKAYGYDLKGFYVMEEFYDKNINDYYNSLQMGLHHNFYFGRKDADITEWLEYFISTMANTFEAVGNRVKEIYLNSKEEVNILDTLDKRERWIANYILNNGKIKAKDIASHFKISLNTANNWIKEWLENGFLVRENDKQIRNVDYILTKKYQEKIK